MSACTGMTRAGKTCQITSHSSMKDSNGRLVALPLRHGSPCCLIHAKPFVHCPADLASVSGPIVLMFLDLETTSTDVTTCRIVEFACCSLPGANFAAVVKVPNEILAEPSARAAAMVHGIKDSEILEGALFPVVWGRFLDFVENLLNNYVVDTDEDEDGASQGPSPSSLAWSPRSPPLPRPPDRPAALICAAHNGYTLVQETKTKKNSEHRVRAASLSITRYRFDFPVLLFEIVRHGLSLVPLRRFLFVDTLEVLTAAKDEVSACLKLQCLARAVCTPSDLRAHRAQ
jgi:hypothetical protein